MIGYLLIFLAISVAVGVGVYRVTGRMSIAEHDPAVWAGEAPAEQAPPPPPTNFERLSIARDRLTWHDRIIGSLGLVVVVAVGAASLAFAFYLVGSTAISLLEKAAGGAT
ncbi:MAG: hypothetical protein ACRDG8_04930 [Actinomycetota bacterium]